jgi:hypothetical protein
MIPKVVELLDKEQRYTSVYNYILRNLTQDLKAIIE